jgi:hypothetical protein
MTATSPDITFCLKRIGKDTAGWDTLVVTGAADTATPPENLWAAWSDLEHWPSWSPLHPSVTGTPETGLSAGASFDQQISLGFPIGTTTEHATFDLLEPGRRAAWAGDANGVRNCHLWSFTSLPDGGTRVRNTEVFSGFPVAVLRPIVTRRWNRLFQAAVDGLIGHVSAGQNGSGRH